MYAQGMLNDVGSLENSAQPASPRVCYIFLGYFYHLVLTMHGYYKHVKNRKQVYGNSTKKLFRS